MMTDVLTTRELNRATLARQLLLERGQMPVADAVARLLALQAQEARPAHIGLWSRLNGFTPDHLGDALHDRQVVRATSLRATLHLLAARDYLAFRPLLEPTLAATAAATIKRLPGPPPETERLIPAARAALRGQSLDFAAIRDRMHEEFPDVNDRALGYSVRLNLPLVMVPTRDRWSFPAAARFTMADEWLGATTAAACTPEEFVTRYLAAFGPASPRDLQTFSWLRLKPVFDRLRPDLRAFATESGQVLFDLPEAPRPNADIGAPARFLPEFDSLLLAHDDRTRIIPAEYRARLITRNLRVPAAFLWDGFVRGTWKTTLRKTSVTLTLTPFGRLPARAVRELSAEADRMLQFTDPGIAARDVRVAQAE